jgi:hypothetical protein
MVLLVGAFRPSWAVAGAAGVRSDVTVEAAEHWSSGFPLAAAHSAGGYPMGAARWWSGFPMAAAHSAGGYPTGELAGPVPRNLVREKPAGPAGREVSSVEFHRAAPVRRPERPAAS